MKKLISAATFVALLFAMPVMTMAKGKKHGGFKGKVTAVDSHSITVANKKSGETKTFKLDDTVKVTIEDVSDKHIADIKPKMKVTVVAGATPDVAASIEVKKHKGKKGKKAATT